ncbi:MAG: STAS domain-containing protein [Lachnospiraceae bacterium]|nr:STAS domain-containing protein [Lachnospiraceae bacterium]
MLDIAKKIEDGCAYFTLEGRLDTVTSSELENELKDVLYDVDEVVFDLENLDYISSAGLRVLLSTQKNIGEEGSMKVVNVNDTIMEIFDVTGFTDILDIE